MAPFFKLKSLSKSFKLFVENALILGLLT